MEWLLGEELFKNGGLASQVCIYVFLYIYMYMYMDI